MSYIIILTFKQLNHKVIFVTKLMLSAAVIFGVNGDGRVD